MKNIRCFLHILRRPKRKYISYHAYQTYIRDECPSWYLSQWLNSRLYMVCSWPKKDEYAALLMHYQNLVVSSTYVATHDVNPGKYMNPSLHFITYDREESGKAEAFLSNLSIYLESYVEKTTYFLYTIQLEDATDSNRGYSNVDTTPCIS